MIYYFQTCCVKFNESDNYFGVNDLILTSPILGNVYAITIPSFSGCATLIQGPIPSGSLIYDAKNGSVVLYPDCADCIENAYSCFPPPPPQPAITYIQSNECDVITIFPMTVECEVINPSTVGGRDGRASISITGGTPPYTVTWADGSISPAIMELEAGSYPAKIVDFYGDFTAYTTCELFGPTPTPTPTKTLTPTPTQTPTLTPTKTPTLTPTKTLTPTPTLTRTSGAVPTNTPTPTQTLTPTKTLTPTPTKTLTPTPTTSSPSFETFTMIARSLNSFSLINGFGFRVVASLPFRVVWGDGNTTNYPSGTVEISHTYSTPYTGNILIQSSDLTSITELLPRYVSPQITSTSVRYLEIETSQLNLLNGLVTLNDTGNSCFYSGNINLLPLSLTTFKVLNSNCSGNIANLPSNMVEFSVNLTTTDTNYSNTIMGNVGDLPTTLTTIRLGGYNTVSGNVQDFPPLMIIIQITGQNIIAGNISLMSTPNLSSIVVYGNNTISGDLGGLSNTVAEIQLTGNNTVTGDISTLPPNLTRLAVTGNNTLYGNIGSLNYTQLIELSIGGSNIISGNISSINLITSSTFSLTGNNTVTGNIGSLGNSNIYSRLTIGGNNTISGNIQNLPSNSRNVTISGNNTISGDLSLVHLNINYLQIDGNNTITTFSNSSRVFTNLSYIKISGTGFNSTNINNLLTSYSISTWSGSKQLLIKGTSTPKYTNITSYNTLQSLGVSIIIS